MKSIKLSMMVLTIAVLAYACKKDKKTEEPQTPAQPVAPTVYDNYSQLKIGNYWIYQQYKIDTLGNVTALSTIDSCYVVKDTIMNGRTFFKIYSPHYIYNHFFMSDSLHYIISPGNNIKFSSQDFTTVFDSRHNLAQPGDTIYQASSKMTDKDLSVTVGAGTFITSNFKTTYNFYPNWRPYGNISKTRSINTRYAKNIGIVTETLPFFLNDPNYIERRLIRYHLN